MCACFSASVIETCLSSELFQGLPKAFFLKICRNMCVMAQILVASLSQWLSWKSAYTELNHDKRGVAVRERATSLAV